MPDSKQETVEFFNAQDIKEIYIGYKDEEKFHASLDTLIQGYVSLGKEKLNKIYSGEKFNILKNMFPTLAKEGVQKFYNDLGKPSTGGQTALTYCYTKMAAFLGLADALAPQGELKKNVAISVRPSFIISVNQDPLCTETRVFEQDKDNWIVQLPKFIDMEPLFTALDIKRDFFAENIDNDKILKKLIDNLDGEKKKVLLGEYEKILGPNLDSSALVTAILKPVDKERTYYGLQETWGKLAAEFYEEAFGDFVGAPDIIGNYADGMMAGKVIKDALKEKHPKTVLVIKPHSLGYDKFLGYKFHEKLENWLQKLSNDLGIDKKALRKAIPAANIPSEKDFINPVSLDAVKIYCELEKNIKNLQSLTIDGREISLAAAKEHLETYPKIWQTYQSLSLSERLVTESPEFLNANADVVLAQSPDMEKLLKERGVKNVGLLTPGYDADTYKRRIETPEQKVERIKQVEILLGLKAGTLADSTTVLFIGRLDERKGALDLLAGVKKAKEEIETFNATAIERGLEKIPPLKVMMIGAKAGAGASPAEQALSNASMETIREYGLKDTIILCERQMPPVVAAAANIAKIFAMPSQYEPFGIVYLEGGAATDFLIGSDNSGAANFLPPLLQRVYQTRNADDLADAVLTAAQNPNAAKYAADVMAKIIEQTSSWTAYARNLRQYIDTARDTIQKETLQTKFDQIGQQLYGFLSEKPLEIITNIMISLNISKDAENLKEQRQYALTSAIQNFLQTMDPDTYPKLLLNNIISIPEIDPELGQNSLMSGTNNYELANRVLVATDETLGEQEEEIDQSKSQETSYGIANTRDILQNMLRQEKPLTDQSLLTKFFEGITKSRR